MDESKYMSRKFILTVIGLVGYMTYCIVTATEMSAFGIAAVIGAYGLSNVMAGGE